MEWDTDDARYPRGVDWASMPIGARDEFDREAGAERQGRASRRAPSLDKKWSQKGSERARSLSFVDFDGNLLFGDVARHVEWRDPYHADGDDYPGIRKVYAFYCAFTEEWTRRVEELISEQLDAVQRQIEAAQAALLDRVVDEEVAVARIDPRSTADSDPIFDSVAVDVSVPAFVMGVASTMAGSVITASLSKLASSVGAAKQRARQLPEKDGILEFHRRLEALKQATDDARGMMQTTPTVAQRAG